MATTIRRALYLAGALGLMSLFGSALAQSSHDPNAEKQVKLGIELKNKGDLVGAEGHYREAIRLDARYAEAHYNYGILLTERGDTNGSDLEGFRQLRKHDRRRRTEHVLIEVVNCCQ